MRCTIILSLLFVVDWLFATAPLALASTQVSASNDAHLERADSFKVRSKVLEWHSGGVWPQLCDGAAACLAPTC